MNGKIEIINRRQSKIAIRTENDDFSIVELIGGYSPELGDIVSGELEDLGGGQLKNLTQDEIWDVYIDDIHASKQTATKQLSKR